MRTGVRVSPSWLGGVLRSRIRCSRLIIGALEKSLADGAGHTFFETEAGANEPARQRSGISLLAGRGGELGRQFRHGDVGLLDDLRQKKRPMRFELGVASAAARLGYEASPRANGFHQVHHEGNRHFEMRRSGATRLAVLDKPDNALTQIKRIGLRHRESPPAGSESRNTPYRNPPRFNLTIRRSSTEEIDCSRSPT